MIRETIEVIRMYILMLRYYSLSTKMLKHALKMVKYINDHQGKFKTRESREILNEMHRICIKQQKMNDIGSRR